MVEPRPLDLLFVESAWHGNGDAWQYHLAGPSAPRPALVELLAWCREQGVPTVFWNKEDPAHYDDFLATARLFDHVLTTDEGRLPAYRRDLGHERVGLLPFAAQPAVHNPVRLPPDQHQSRDLLFGGMYFAHKFPERRAQMDLLLGAAERVSARMDTGLEIFSRYLGGDERYQFPAPLDARVVGSLDYARMLTATRAYKVVLNVNSVVDSPSMCARRVLEASACGTPVVSTPSAAIDRVFAGDEVLRVGTPEEAEWTLRALVGSPEMRDRTVHLAQRRIWAAHTYGHRVDDVLAAAGLATRRRARPRVSALVSTNRPQQLDHVLRTLGAQVDVDLQVVLLAHGWDLPTDVAERAAAHGVTDLVTLTAPAELTLGECLNRLVTAADGDVVAKVDDDDLYGPHYLSDQLYALDYSGAEVVGKQAHHMYLEGQDVTILRFPDREHRYNRPRHGPDHRHRARRRPRPPVRRRRARRGHRFPPRRGRCRGPRLLGRPFLVPPDAAYFGAAHMGGRFDRAARRGPCRGIRATAGPRRLLRRDECLAPQARTARPIPRRPLGPAPSSARPGPRALPPGGGAGRRVPRPPVPGRSNARPTPRPRRAEPIAP